MIEILTNIFFAAVALMFAFLFSYACVAVISMIIDIIKDIKYRYELWKYLKENR